MEKFLIEEKKQEICGHEFVSVIDFAKINDLEEFLLGSKITLMFMPTVLCLERNAKGVIIAAEDRAIISTNRAIHRFMEGSWSGRRLAYGMRFQEFVIDSRIRIFPKFVMNHLKQWLIHKDFDQLSEIITNMHRKYAYALTDTFADIFPDEIIGIVINFSYENMDIHQSFIDDAYRHVKSVAIYYIF